MSGQSGVWGEHRSRFSVQLQDLIAGYRISAFGMADLHLTAADFIDTTNDYLDFFKVTAMRNAVYFTVSFRGQFSITQQILTPLQIQLIPCFVAAIDHFCLRYCSPNW